MTLEQMRALCAVVERGGFRPAAEALHRSQSALSVAVRKLEAELDLTLFDRGGYRPVPTPAGEALYRRARFILSQVDDVRRAARHHAAGEEPELGLAVSGIVPIEPVIGVLNGLALDAPATRITMQIENLGGAMERLADGDADIAITDVLEDPALFHHEPLTEVTFVSVVGRSSPLAARADRLRLRDVSDATLVVVRDTSVRRPRLTKGVVGGGQQWVVNDFTAKKRIIASGGGWGRLPRHMVAEELRRGELVRLSSDDFRPAVAPVYMVRRRTHPPGPVGERLWRRLRDASWSA